MFFDSSSNPEKDLKSLSRSNKSFRLRTTRETTSFLFLATANQYFKATKIEQTNKTPEVLAMLYISAYTKMGIETSKNKKTVNQSGKR